MFCFVSSRGLSAMPEGSHSALHQGPMGEGKVNAIITSEIHALVIAAYELNLFYDMGIKWAGVL